MLFEQLCSTYTPSKSQFFMNFISSCLLSKSCSLKSYIRRNSATGTSSSPDVSLSKIPFASSAFFFAEEYANTPSIPNEIISDKNFPINFLHSCFVSPDLCVPVLCCRSLRKIHPLENGVLPKLLFDGEHGLLNFLFSCQLFILLLALRVERSIIGEEVKLLKSSLWRG